MPASHCEVRLTRRYDAAPAEVWQALTDSQSLGRWLASPCEVELQSGGAFELAFPDETRIEARVREVQPERLLELDWTYADEDPSVVRFELTADGDGTLLVLDHRRIDERLGMAYISRWSRSIARVAEELAG